LDVLLKYLGDRTAVVRIGI